MADTPSLLRFYERSPLLQLFLSLLIILGIGILLFIVLIVAGVYIFGTDISLIEDPTSAIEGKDIAFLRYLLIVQGISLFIVPAIIILVFLRLESQRKHIFWRAPDFTDILLVLILSFAVFPITSFTGQLNSMMTLPEWLSGVEKWMMDKEESIGDMLDMLINSDTFGVMLLNLIIIAVIPAIGEELIFRGVFQKICYKLFGSGHLAVWIIAFFFSAIHFQFYGFIPRFILGLVYGYLFLWSRNIWLSILSHFVNNAVPVIAAYLTGWEKANNQPEISMWKQLVFLALPLIVVVAVLGYLRGKSGVGNDIKKNIEQGKA